jgi:RNA polymerase sigma-70 factor (ECF subfamily)
MPGTLNSGKMQPVNQETTPATDSRGQKEARFEREVLPHLDRVYCAALCLVDDQAEAGELVQETFARAYAEFGPTSPGRNVTAWLYRFLLGSAADSVPGQGAAADGIGSRPSARAWPCTRSGVSPAEIRAVMRLPGPVVKGALRQLPRDSRLAVYLAYVEGLACREIAEVTEAPIETVTRWLRCGRRQLRWLLRDHAARSPDPAAYGLFAAWLRLPAEPPRGRSLTMESQLAFLDCPAWLDRECLTRCGLPAEVLRRFIMESTSGPLESATIKCPVGHYFIAPVEFLSLESDPAVPERPLRSS